MVPLFHYYSPPSSNVKRLFFFIVANYKYISKSAPHRLRDGYIYYIYSKNIQLTHKPPAPVIMVYPCRNVRWNCDSVANGTPIKANQHIILSVQVLVVDTYQARHQQVSIFSHRKLVELRTVIPITPFICCLINTRNIVKYPRPSYPRVSSYAISRSRLRLS